MALGEDERRWLREGRSLAWQSSSSTLPLLLLLLCVRTEARSLQPLHISLRPLLAVVAVPNLQVQRPCLHNPAVHKGAC